MNSDGGQNSQVDLAASLRMAEELVASLRMKMTEGTPDFHVQNSHDTLPSRDGRLCMKGNIYTKQKCSLCPEEGTMRHDERRSGCFCPVHPEQEATRQFYVKFGNKIRKGFSTYEDASRFLTTVRYETDKGIFDPRDHDASNPMSFNKLSLRFFKEKRDHNSYRDIKRHIEAAAEVWGDKNVKTITTAHIKEFLDGLEVKDKTRSNYKSTLHDFFSRHLVDTGILQEHQVPRFPKVNYTLGFRVITDWDTQDDITEELYRITWERNPKIWLGADLLRTYTNLRPGDALKLTEGGIDLKKGFLTIWKPTKGDGAQEILRSVQLLDEHVHIIATLKKQFPAMPHMKFFRHHGGIKGTNPGQPWGPKYLNTWWNKACENLGISGIPLYPGTRHTTTTETARVEGKEAARKASGHKSDKAFDRYCQVQDEGAFEVSKIIRQHMKPIVVPLEKGKSVAASGNEVSTKVNESPEDER